MTDRCHFYLRLPDRTPVGVVALEVFDPVDLLDPPEVRVAASLCHEVDQWVRSAGVNKAKGRLKSDRCSIIAGRDSSLVEVLDDLCIDFYRRGVDMQHAEALFRKQVDYLTTEPEGEHK